MSTIIYPSPIFGPVTSRRLGRSLGVNLLPEDGKICNFDCIYCECGLNAEHRAKKPMPTREHIARELELRLQRMREAGQPLDALTYSGNGEPTSHPDFLDIVKDTIALRDKYYPQARVCLLTNATRLGKDHIFEAVQLLDKACLKLDTVDAQYIELVDRPTGHYDVQEVLERMQALGGRCIVQTMFMKGQFEGKSVDNTTDEYVEPWVQAVCKIRPEGVDIYTIDRETPVAGLIKATRAELEAIADKVRAHGIHVDCYVR